MVGRDFGAASTPEFLREGSAVQDALKPDRIVVGGYDAKSTREVLNLYSSFKAPKVKTDIRTAEMIKYAANTFLATKIAFTNELANICEAVGVDVYRVMEAVGMDSRISPQFLRAGSGFGGSCFPKDLSALIELAKDRATDPIILNAVQIQNQIQPLITVEMLEMELGNLDGKNIALLGLAFKPDTDDIRYTRAEPIARSLLDLGARVAAYDPSPVARKAFGKIVPGVIVVDDLKSALKGRDGCIVQTEWAAFKKLKPGDFKRYMKKPVVIDGRRTYDPEKMLKGGVTYRAIGLGEK
jgi:UDPglucose 6-dehydrogenase